MKVPARDSKYSFNLKIFKLHNDKKSSTSTHASLASTASPPTSPMISTKRNSWRTSWRAAIGVGQKSKSVNNNNNNISSDDNKSDNMNASLVTENSNESCNQLYLNPDRIPNIDDMMCK